MSHRYFPHSQEDITSMLETCGVKTLEDLYADVPEQLKFKGTYNVPSEMSEHEVRKFFNDLGKKNTTYETILAGAGFYDHQAPAAIASLISRSEFLTAYTPYQPEISQGTLQYIFEYQSMMASLTGMEVSNASMYDGATATAEAMMMAVAAGRKKNRVLISATVAPAVKSVVRTYAKYHGIAIDEIPATANGTTSLPDMEKMLEAGDVAGVIVATPNFYGILEDYAGVADMCHKVKSLLIMHCIAGDLASIKSPGEWGADIAVGDAQSLGIPLSFGGPYLGFLCAKKALMRKMPGRIVGATKDSEGRRTFVLTLQAREQHIRREKATSNICSNQGLMALYVTIYMSLLGTKGLQETVKAGVAGAHWLCDKLTATGKFSQTYPDSVYLNEFCLTAHDGTCVEKFMRQADAAGILAGVRLDGDNLLIAVTETASRESLEKLVEIANNL